MGPDPYRDWLAIKTDDQTPNHYELLGITLFSGDSDAVRQAYEDRYALVRRYEVGNYGDRASALMAELSDAFACLTNDLQKSQYDRELRETLAARETRADVGVLHDTLVEEISELEAIVEFELQEDNPRVVATPHQTDPLAERPVSAASSYLVLSAPSPLAAKADKRELAIPVWLAALGTCAAGLFVIGAIAVVVNIFGSRDEQASTGHTVAAPPAAGDRGDSSAAVAESAVAANAGDVSAKNAWRGRLARVLVDDEGTLHLLVAADRLFEARSKDRDLMQQLAGYVCLAEDAELADEVRVAGTVVDKASSFFDPERRLRRDQGAAAVLELQSVELVENARSGITEMSEQDKYTLLNLRSAGQYAQFVATISSPFESKSRTFRATFHGRAYLVEVPDAWRAVGVVIRQGQQVAVVTRTTGRYESPAGARGIDDLLVLEVETINQPSFEKVLQLPSQFVGQTIAYPAVLTSTVMQEDVATLSLRIRNEAKDFSITGLAGIQSGQDAYLEKLEGHDPLLVELEVDKGDSLTTFKVVSLTRLNDAADRVVFGAVVGSKPAPKPVVRRPEPKPARQLALASLPDYVDLPPLSSQSPELLTSAIEAAELEIGLASDLIALADAYRFVAKKVDDSQPLRWEIYLQKALDVGTQEVLVAHLAVADERLAFRWTENAVKLPAGQLRNCIMQFKSGPLSHDIALRSPVRTGETSLPSEEAKFNVTFNLEDLPNAERLCLDVELTYGGAKIESQARTDTATRGKRLDFKLDALPNVEIQVVLLSPQDNSLALHALPRLQLSASRQLTLTTEEVDDHEQRIRQSGVKAERSIAKAQNSYQQARNAFSRASDSATRARFGAIVETQSKAIATNQRNLIEMQQALNAVGSIRAMVGAVQSNTRLRYRVYAKAGETSLLLVDGDYREDEALRQ